MKLAQYSINNRAVVWIFILMMAVGGMMSYQKLGRLQDPEFTIKEAVIMTRYPGATALEVESEVTEPIETAVQQLKQLHEVKSISRPGLSIVRAEMKDMYDKDTLPQVWDEMRRKVGEAAAKLPPGVSAPLINDDFGDVYGIYLALTGDGYSMHDLKELAEDIRLELMVCTDVGRVGFNGIQQEVIFVEIDRSRLAALGLSPLVIFNTISQQNTVAFAGNTQAGSELLTMEITGAFEDLDSIRELLVSGRSGELIRIKDVAEVSRGYYEPATSMLLFNGKQAIGIGVSTVSGGNVVAMGDSIKQKMLEIQTKLPVGVELNTISYQSDTVSDAVNGFVLNLFEAVGIVLVVLILFMGWREGIIIGVVLLLTILATFQGMQLAGVTLQRISLGALIIALGMLVDNAIVVVEGIMIKMQKGMDARKAAYETVAETQWPLLGATVIAILAFAAISISKDVTGEFLRSLFQVIAISLGLSWVLAVTVTPFLCVLFLKPSTGEAIDADPYKHIIYRTYRSILKLAIRFRWLTVGAVVIMLTAAFIGFGFVSKNFFPDSSRPQYTVSLWGPEGTHLNTTKETLEDISTYLQNQEGVGDITCFVGQGGMRFILTYATEMPSSAYGQLLVSVDNYQRIPEMMAKTRAYIEKHHCDLVHQIDFFKLGPAGAAVEARLVGNDEAVLYSIADKYMSIMRGNDNAESIRSDWGNQVKTVHVKMSETRSRESGVSRADIARSIAMNYTGIIGGTYREGNDVLPIMMRSPAHERRGIEQINDVQVWSSVSGRFSPLDQMVDRVDLKWSSNVIRRFNRKRTVTISCKQIEGTASDLFKQLRPQIEEVELPEGYSLEWGGEYENSTEANQKLGANIPLALFMMFLISVMLFNSFRHPLIIFTGLPLALIGVTAGLLISGQPFGFMATLGFLSLTGMLIKNEIVLLEQVNIEMATGKQPFLAVVDAAVSRVRPVSMAALTTVLGMIPLIWDPFFAAMAVTIMAGLTFATVLTLIVVPVLYSICFRVKTIRVDTTLKKAK